MPRDLTDSCSFLIECKMMKFTKRMTMTAIMPYSTVLLAILVGFLGSCEGVPVTENPNYLSGPEATPSMTTAPASLLSNTMPTTTTTTAAAAATTTTTTMTTIKDQMVEGHPMDDLLPGSSSTTSQPTTPTSPTSLSFADVPPHTETTLGASVLLACRTNEPVVECQWSWRPLPPTTLPLPNIDNVSSESIDAKDSTTTTTKSPTPTTASLSLPVRTFPAFGSASNDCSVRFSSVKHEQTGYWSCAARRVGDESFTSTGPAKLSIVQLDKAAQVKFKRPSLSMSSLESPAGSATRLPCRTRGRVHECQWSWRPLNQSRPFDAEIRRFPAAGDNNTDCELGLPAVHSEHEGFWTCGARVNSGSPFVQASPIRLLISEVEFVQLSRGIQITAGETVSLRCLVNKPAYQCEWSWRSSNSSKNSTLLRQFEPAKDNDHDCSVRFKIVYEEEGLWTCGVRLTPEGILHEAPSTTVALLPSGRVNFTETPESTSVALGADATLRCATNGRLERCAWSWRPLAGAATDTEPAVRREFPSHGELGHNCSLTLPRVSLEEQGFWTCQVYSAPATIPIVAPVPAKLSVYEEGEVRFSKLSKDFLVASGAAVSLSCVTTARVEMCRWSLTSQVSANTTVVVKQFEPADPEARDCSVKLSHALQEQEGLWTCGARLHARQNYTDAPPARLSLIEPGPITVTVWGMPHQMSNLACKMSLSMYEPQCYWMHGPDIILREIVNATRKMKYTVSMNHTSGVCSLQFVPDDHDFGEWICQFRVDNDVMQAGFGTASILLLNNSPDQQLSWLVGAITSTILFLLIIAVVIVVYKSRNRRIPAFLETIPATEYNTSSNNRVTGQERYVHGPAKINLSYINPNFLSSTENINNVLPNRSPHMYERVAKRIPTQRTYENIRG